MARTMSGRTVRAVEMALVIEPAYLKGFMSARDMPDHKRRYIGNNTFVEASLAELMVSESGRRQDLQNCPLSQTSGFRMATPPTRCGSI
jgi:hypothetical protein